MKKILTFLFFAALSIQSLAQTLTFDTISVDTPYCRLFGYQNGQGIISMSATGGTPPYTYQWKEVGTFNTTSNSTWGGINPGDYEAKVWDSAGDSIVQVISVDSVNPIASFEIISGPTSGAFPNYSGNVGVYEFQNTSQYYAFPPWNPTSDTFFIWQFTQFDTLTVVHDLSNQQYDYQYGGTWAITLSTSNKNGCQDTTVAYITINGPANIKASNESVFSIISNSSQNKIVIDGVNMEENYKFNIYDLSGKLIQQEQLIDPTTNIPFYQKGIFVYEIIDPKNQAIIHSGKFNF